MKKAAKILFGTFLAVGMILYSDKTFSAALNGLDLWLYTIIPTLFPFMVLFSWITPKISAKGGRFDFIAKRLFGISSSLMSVFVFGFISGYPMGAKMIADLRKSNSVSKAEAQHMLSFCNNAGAVFIYSAVSNTMLKNSRAVLFLLPVCIASSLITGITYNIFFCDKIILRENNRINDFVEPTFSYALYSAVKSVLTIGGCIVFFSVVSEAVLTILPFKNPNLKCIVSGLLEFSGGISLTAKSELPTKIIYPLVAAMLSWGGISVHIQTAAIMDGCGIDMGKYILCKAFSACISFIIGFFAFKNLFEQSVPVFAVHNMPVFLPSVLVCIFIVIMRFFTNEKSPR